jgi:hypothetical protein
MKKLHPIISTYEEAKHFIETASIDINFFYFNNIGGYDSFVLVGGFKPYRTNISLINTYSSFEYFRLVINEAGHKTTYDITKQEFNTFLKEIQEIVSNKKLKLNVVYSETHKIEDLKNRVMDYGIHNFSMSKYKNQAYS